jgi:FlaA1/EpsC-like NDP-sugar epimerase
MDGKRLIPRTLWLILADTAIIYGGIVLALYLRVGFSGSDYELNERNAWFKIALATFVCQLILYFYDLYDYTIMGNRRELMLRLVQSLGIAWAMLAFLFYFVPSLFIGRGVSVISLPVVLVLLLVWRILIHYLTGHPDIGEKIVIVGTGSAALDTAEAVWKRRDAGYRIVGFVTENGSHPEERPEVKILGAAENLEEIIKTENINRLVIACPRAARNFSDRNAFKNEFIGRCQHRRMHVVFRACNRTGASWYGAPFVADI